MNLAYNRNMPNHKPIKFEILPEKNLGDRVSRIIRENKYAQNAGKALLALTVIGGLLTLSALSVNTVGALANISARRKNIRRENYRNLWRNFREMKRRHELEFVEDSGDYLVYRLTPKGKKLVNKFVFEEMTIKAPKVWDNRWRLIIFDIPEKFRQGRDALRRKLEDLGFYQCQKSVWIHPFECIDEVGFIKEMFEIKSFVSLFTVDDMTDGRIMYYFKDLLKNRIKS